MAALRNIACNDRWGEAWPRIAAQLQQERLTQRLQKHPQPTPPPPITNAKEAKQKAPSAPEATGAHLVSDNDQKTHKKGSRPSPDHPWRKFSFGKGRFQDFTKGDRAKS